MFQFLLTAPSGVVRVVVLVVVHPFFVFCLGAFGLALCCSAIYSATPLRRVDCVWNPAMVNCSPCAVLFLFFVCFVFWWRDVELVLEASEGGGWRGIIFCRPRCLDCHCCFSCFYVQRRAVADCLFVVVVGTFDCAVLSAVEHTSL